VYGLIKVTAILYIFVYSRMGHEILPMTYDGLWNFSRFSGWATVCFFWKTYFSLRPTLAVTLWPVPNYRVWNRMQYEPVFQLAFALQLWDPWNILTLGYTCCDFGCDFRLLMNVNEWMSYEYGNEGTKIFIFIYHIFQTFIIKHSSYF
jgi:hypothetical protein